MYEDDEDEFAHPDLIIGELPRATVIPYARGELLHLPGNLGDIEHHLDQSAEGPHMSGAPDTDFAKLVTGKTIGKRTVIFTPAGVGGISHAPVDMFTIQGPDGHAIAMSVTLSSPHTILNPGAAPADVQSLTNELDNEQVLVAASGRVVLPCAAIIEWGIGGVQSRVDVDYINGLSLNLHASFVRMRGFIDNTQSGGLLVPQATVLSAFIGPGSPSSNVAQRTAWLGNSDGSDVVGSGTKSTAVVPLPRYARAVTVAGSALIGAAINPLAGTITFTRDGNGSNIVARYTIGTLSTDVPHPIPIPNGAYYVQWTNPAGDPGYTASPFGVFQLAL